MLSESYATVSPAEVGALMERGAVMVDVRDPSEWRAGHAPKAQHIPLAQLGTRMGEIPAGCPIVTVCRSGQRSSRAAGQLAAQGREVSNVAGGMMAWEHAGLPVIANGGRVGQII